MTRSRVNKPLDQEAYKRLEVERTTLGEALEALGAPDKIESKSEKDYLWYLHQDATRVGFRIQSPVSFFGYQHTFAELDADAEDTSAMRLVFEKDGTLIQKSLRLAPAFSGPEIEKPRWGLYLMPRYGLSPIVFGDGGEEDYGELFSNGQLFGGYLGLLPVPYFMAIVGGNFQDYDGGSFKAGGARVSLEDLHLYQFEVGGRFSVPPEFFVSFWSLEKLKELFYSNDVERHRGLLFYFQWTLGGTFNEEVGARLDGVPSGSYFDKSLGFSNTVGTGIEVHLRRLGIFAGMDYQVIGAFDGGSAPLDTDAGGFQSIIFTAGLSLRF